MKASQRGLMPSTGIGVGLLASILLAALTISVFYVLQDYGPESAIRKYNEAVFNNDIGSADLYATQPYGRSEAAHLVFEAVRRSLAVGGRLRLLHMDRSPNGDAALAVVAYVYPNGAVTQFDFEVVKQDHIWKVDPIQSLDAMRRAVRFG